MTPLYLTEISPKALAFASTFYFFTTHNANTVKNKKILQATAPTSAEFVQTSTDRALNLACFGQPVCELQTVVIRTNSKAAGNIRLKEILKKGALTVKRTLVHLSISSGYTYNRASNPPFLKLL